VDIVAKQKVLPLIDHYHNVLPFSEIIPISALKLDNLDRLLETIIKYMPEGPKYYPEEIVTDQLERFMVDGNHKGKDYGTNKGRNPLLCSSSS